MATVKDVQTACPEARQLEPGEVQVAIDNAALELAVDVWSTLLDRGIALLAGHNLASAHPELYLGENVPTRPTPPQGAVDAGLGDTVYGVAFWRLRRTLAFARGGLLVGP